MTDKALPSPNNLGTLFLSGWGAFVVSGNKLEPQDWVLRQTLLHPGTAFSAMGEEQAATRTPCCTLLLSSTAATASLQLLGANPRGARGNDRTKEQLRLWNAHGFLCAGGKINKPFKMGRMKNVWQVAAHASSRWRRSASSSSRILTGAGAVPVAHPPQEQGRQTQTFTGTVLYYRKVYDTGVANRTWVPHRNSLSLF